MINEVTLKFMIFFIDIQTKIVVMAVLFIHTSKHNTHRFSFIFSNEREIFCQMYV